MSTFTIPVARFAPIVSHLNAIRRADAPKHGFWGVRFFTFDGAWRMECALPGLYVRHRLAAHTGDPGESRSFVLGLADLADVARGARGDLTVDTDIDTDIDIDTIIITRSDGTRFHYSLNTYWESPSRDTPARLDYVLRTCGRAWREMWRGLHLYRMRKPDYRITGYDRFADICLLGTHLYASDAKRVIRYGQHALDMPAPSDTPILLSGTACALAAEIAGSNEEITFYHGENRTIIESEDFYIDAHCVDHQWPDRRRAFNGESMPIAAQVYAPKNAIRSLRAIGAHTAKRGVALTANPDSGCLIAEVGEASTIVNGITVDPGTKTTTTILDGKFLLDGLAAMGTSPGVIRFPEDEMPPHGDVDIGAAVAFEDTHARWAARVMPMRKKNPGEY